MPATYAVDILSAARDLITARNLPAPGIAITGGSVTARRWNPETQDWSRPDLPSVTVGGFFHGPDFLAWIHAVGITNLDLGRRDLDTTVNAETDLDGITWKIWGSLNRPQSWARMPVRPRFRNEATVTAGEFAQIVAALGDR